MPRRPAHASPVNLATLSESGFTEDFKLFFFTVKWFSNYRDFRYRIYRIIPVYREHDEKPIHLRILMARESSVPIRAARCTFNTGNRRSGNPDVEPL